MATSTKLNQILAVEKGVKGDTEKVVTLLYHLLQKPPPFTGLTRTYRKIDDNDPDLPSEATSVQVNATAVLDDVTSALTRLFDVTAAKDWTNCTAKADLVVDDHILLAKVPVTYLLFLEKSLVNIETFVRKLPVLDPAETWTLDDNTGAYKTAGTETTRTKKIRRNHVKAPATDKFPAQVDTYDEDTVVGYWLTTKFSGALPATRVAELLNRVTTLSQAVKMAREHANVTQVDDPKPGKTVFDYLFA